jgi:hypothetical protein
MAIIDLIRGQYRRANINEDHIVLNGEKEEKRRAKIHRSVLINFRTKFAIVFPLLWSKKDPWMKARVLVCFLLIVSVCGLNLLVPKLNKSIVNL